MQASAAQVSPALTTKALADQLGEMLRELFVDPSADHFGLIEQRQLTITQVRALVVLAGTDEPIATGGLAERLGVSPPTMTRAIDALAGRRLVGRRECATDRRVRHVSITAAGCRVVEEIVAARRAGLVNWLGTLDESARERLAAALAEIGGQRGWQSR